MATHDYVIDNQSAPALRSDLNNALLAIVSQNSNATAPATTYANMIWYDTTNNQIKKRNEANSAWITLGTVDEGAGTFTPSGERALATEADAEAGTNNTTLMTPLRTAQAISALVSAPTSAQVGTATAGLATGAVGTYAFLRFASATTASSGSTHAGSVLRYSSAAAFTGGTPGGTWRLMGQTSDSSTTASTSVFLRIS